MFRNTLLIMALSIGFVGEAYSQAVARSAKPRGMQTFRQAPERQQREIVQRLYRASGIETVHPRSIEQGRQDLAEISLPLLERLVNYGVTHNTLIRNADVRRSLVDITRMGDVAINAANAVGYAYAQTKSKLSEGKKLTPEITEHLIVGRNGYWLMIPSLRNSQQAEAISVENVRTFFKEGFEEGNINSAKNAVEMQAALGVEIRAGKPIPEATEAAMERVMSTNTELAERLNALTPAERQEFKRRCMI